MEIEETSLDERTSEFTLKGEDHTVANALCTRLQTMAHVALAGYRIPHPLSREVVITVKTDGSLRPSEAVSRAAEQIAEELERFAKLI